MNTPSPSSSGFSHHPPAPFDKIGASFNHRHPAWQGDIVTQSTGGESMRIATVRQLSRALGTVLAEWTLNRTESQALLKSAQDAKLNPAEYPILLGMTVQAIAGAPDFEAATLAAVQAWRGLAREYDLSTHKLLVGLVATTRSSCTEMLQDLLAKPKDGFTNQSMDESIRTVFGVKGDIEQIRIKVLRGHFSASLKNFLGVADCRYQSEKFRVQQAGGDPGPVTPEVAKVSLIIEGSGQRKPNETVTFKVTSADFIKAYVAATFDYAAGAYADRVRRPAR